MVFKKQFNKLPLSIEDQINLLLSRGIVIDDEERAIHYLKFIGYYRLSGYTHHFKTKDDRYHTGTTFEKVLDHYVFDRKLRILLFNTIELVEIALRSVITSVMTSKYGAFWYNQQGIFIKHIGHKPINGYEIALQAIRESTVEKKNKDIFLQHYYDFYDYPELPPSWMLMETLSMGAISRILSLLVVEERKDIAAFFSIKERHLVSWMRSLTYTRNLCAHHARVWDRVFTLKVESDKRYAVCRDELFHKGKLYSHVVVIAILLSVIAPDNNFETHIKELLYSYNYEHKVGMGFPEKWDGFHLQS
ncbi:MAG: Abi family protein [Proteobacteria bacterium]|nr:Abi family protein [Pseudomonadota bacterium]